MKKLTYLLFLIISTIGFYSCDTINQEDTLPGSFQETKLNKNEFRVIANNKLVLDLLSNNQLGLNATVDVGSPLNGTLTSGQVSSFFVYAPNTSYIGKDSIPFKVCTGGVCDSTVVVIHVDAPEQAPCPTAIDDFIYTVKNIPIDIPVLANDSLCLGNNTLQITENPQNGSVILKNDTVSYQPKIDFIGNDVFQYEACNGSDCAKASVFVTVFEKDTAAICTEVKFVAVDDFFEVVLHDSVKNTTSTHYLSPLDNDTIKCMGTEINLKITDAPIKGEATVLSNTIQYTTLQKGALTDKFRYQVCVKINGLTECKDAWFYITLK